MNQNKMIRKCIKKANNKLRTTLPTAFFYVAPNSQEADCFEAGQPIGRGNWLTRYYAPKIRHSTCIRTLSIGCCVQYINWVWHWASIHEIHSHKRNVSMIDELWSNNTMLVIMTMIMMMIILNLYTFFHLMFLFVNANLFAAILKDYRIR